jgi:hypothetical protein
MLPPIPQLLLSLLQQMRPSLENLLPLLLQVHVSKPGDLEFDAIPGGLGVYGVITELVLQMTPASLTTLNTIDGDDANLYPDVQGIVKVRVHAANRAGC